MMKQFDEIKKQMPYIERKEYLDQLIQRATDNAIRQHQTTGRSGQRTATISILRPLMAVAAVALVLIAIGITTFRSPSVNVAQSQQEQAELMAVNDQENGPIDDFLNTLTDDEAQLLAYYDIEEIPEY